MDIVRFHTDGTVLTVSNANIKESVKEFEIERYAKWWLADASAAQLIERLQETPPPADIELVPAINFVRRFTSYYEDDIAAKKKLARERSR